MVRLAVVVEGATEADFVDQVLSVHLLDKGIYPIPTSLNGSVSVQRLAARMAELFWNFDNVTSLVDYYGFEDKDTRTVDQLEQDVSLAVTGMIRGNGDESRAIPYVQLHEFEGLLFSQVGCFDNVPGTDERALEQLQIIRSQFPTPEDINDNPNTAPTKRIRELIRRYNKRVNGIQIAQSIGLSTIRRECPRFDRWLTCLESLAT